MITLARSASPWWWEAPHRPGGAETGAGPWEAGEELEKGPPSGMAESWWLRNPVVCWSCCGKTVCPLWPGPWRAGLGSGGGFRLEGNPLVDRELS